MTAQLAWYLLWYAFYAFFIMLKNTIFQNFRNYKNWKISFLGYKTWKHIDYNLFIIWIMLCRVRVRKLTLLRRLIGVNQYVFMIIAILSHKSSNLSYFSYCFIAYSWSSVKVLLLDVKVTMSIRFSLSASISNCELNSGSCTFFFISFPLY